MLDQFQTVLTVVSLLLAVAVVVYVALDRRPDRPLVGGLALLEVLLVVHLVLAVNALVSEDPAISLATYVGYLLATVVLLPLATFWAIGEPSRGGTAVLLVGLIVVPFLVLRLHQIWAP